MKREVLKKKRVSVMGDRSRPARSGKVRKVGGPREEPEKRMAFFCEQKVGEKDGGERIGKTGS